MSSLFRGYRGELKAKSTKTNRDTNLVQDPDCSTRISICLNQSCCKTVFQDWLLHRKPCTANGNGTLLQFPVEISMKQLQMPQTQTFKCYIQSKVLLFPTHYFVTEVFPSSLFLSMIKIIIIINFKKSVPMLQEPVKLWIQDNYYIIVAHCTF